MSDKPKLKLESVTQLEQELGKRRGTLMQLISDREREQLRLAGAREEYKKLEGEIRDLDKSVAAKNQTIFVLMDEVDWLLRVQERVHERARQLGKKGEAAADNQRTHSRHALAVEVTAQSETHFYTGFSQNISEGGLFVATYDTRPVGERFPVKFALPTAEGALECMAEVAWVREYREGEDLKASGAVPGMGLRFVGLTDETWAQISAFLDHREPLFFPEFDELS